MSIFRGAMRNVEDTEDPRLPEAGTHVPDLGLTEDQIGAFQRSLSKYKAYFYHLAEGVDNTARKRFMDLVANQLVQESLVGIHSLGLKPEDLNAMAEKGAKVVWSPFSNLLLYGKTLDLKAMKDSGALFCIGCDWSPSGGKNLLQEMKVARFELENQKSGHNSSDLVRAVTCNPAAILSWGQYLGSLKPGAFADLLVVGGTGADPYDHLIDATEQDISFVVVHGIPRYGIKNIMQRIHSDTQNDLETIVVGGEERSLYLYSPGSSLNDLTFEQSRETLTNAMADLPAFLQSTKEENNRLKAMGIRVEQKFRIVLDNELESPETRTSDMRAKATEADWSKIAKSVELDRFEVDFPSYWKRLGEQVNIDDGLRQMLKEAYAR
jgi:5-methylthioadenosine/S-adenosylhomocysteine deaminase